MTNGLGRCAETGQQTIITGLQGHASHPVSSAAHQTLSIALLIPAVLIVTTLPHTTTESTGICRI